MMRAFLLASCAAVTCACAARPRAASPEREIPPLPLGPPHLTERRLERQLAPGLHLTTIRRGARGPAERFAVDLLLAPDEASARTAAARAEAAGIAVGVRRIERRADDDPKPGPLGFLVRTPGFTERADAGALAKRLAAAGFAQAHVADTAQDGFETQGPWTLQVLRLDAKAFRGRIETRLGADPGLGLNTVSAIAQAAGPGAIAAVNGGYFVMVPEDGRPGDPAGIAILDGQLVSEAVEGRTALLLWASELSRSRVGRVTTQLELRAEDGSTATLDGIDRSPGLVRNCGGRGGDSPSERPLHDVTCADSEELVLLTRRFGAESPAGAGVEAVRGPDGRVTLLRPRGGPIPEGASVVVATGSHEGWLREHARDGGRLELHSTVTVDGEPLVLDKGLFAVNGGPRLLRDGQVELPACGEGFCVDDAFYWYFAHRRHPRTFVGRTADGDLLIVVADGRQPEHSIGLTFEECARVLLALGAVDGINLDGGGSTALVAAGSLQTRPSDPKGERRVGDALVIFGPREP